jgi:ribosomal protein S25
LELGTEINEETVKALDEKVFDEILKEVQKLNELSDSERKN